MAETTRDETLLIHGGIPEDPRTGAVNVPIYQTSTYRQDELGRHRGYEYSRTGNPTREALEKLIADLEGGRFGFAFASGMAALTTVLSLFSAGDEILTSANVYGGTFRVLDKVFRNFGIAYRMVDTTDADAFEAQIGPNTKAVIVESPANPLLDVTDIAEIAKRAKARGVMTIVDNTFMTPYLQKPLELGADVVVHSATKYLGGHSDVVAGLAVVDDEETAKRLAFLQNATGGVLGPFDSFLLIRGIKTLGVRLDRHCENALAVAEFLRASDAVETVHFPGFADHPGHAVQARQARGAGAMISFSLRENVDLRLFLKSLRLVALAESLGGVESLICHPSTMTHASIPEEIRKKVGISDSLLRLSVGIEHRDDIVADLKRALDAART